MTAAKEATLGSTPRTLVNSVRKALTIELSLSSLAQALNIDEDQVLRLAEPDQDPEDDQEPG